MDLMVPENQHSSKFSQRLPIRQRGMLKSVGKVSSLLEVGTGFHSGIDREGKHLFKWLHIGYEKERDRSKI